MKRRKHTPDQVVRKLREADRLLAEGEIAEVAKHLKISEQTYHRWRKQYGGLKADDAKRLKSSATRTPRRRRSSAGRGTTGGEVGHHEPPEVTGGGPGRRAAKPEERPERIGRRRPSAAARR